MRKPNLHQLKTFAKNVLSESSDLSDDLVRLFVVALFFWAVVSAWSKLGIYIAIPFVVLCGISVLLKRFKTKKKKRFYVSFMFKKDGSTHFSGATIDLFEFDSSTFVCEYCTKYHVDDCMVLFFAEVGNPN